MVDTKSADCHNDADSEQPGMTVDIRGGGGAKPKHQEEAHHSVRAPGRAGASAAKSESKDAQGHAEHRSEPKEAECGVPNPSTSECEQSRARLRVRRTAMEPGEEWLQAEGVGTEVVVIVNELGGGGKGAVADGRGELRHSAHRDFAQLTAVQHEERCITGRGHPHDGT